MTDIHASCVPQQIDEATRAITTQTMYSCSNPAAVLQGIAAYFGDRTLLEPRLLRICGDILPRLDQTLGDRAGGDSAPRQ